MAIKRPSVSDEKASTRKTKKAEPKANNKEQPKVKRKAAVEPIEEKPKRKSAKSTEEQEIAEPSFDAYAGMDDILDVIEKEVGLSTSGNKQRVTLSTGLLSLDLVLSGGLVSGGMYTFAGGEQSSKSTLAMTQLARAAVSGHVKTLLYADAEGSYDGNYMMAIAKAQGFKGNATDLFGLQDPDTGKYIKPPIIRRYPITVGERFFDLVYKLERSLPDKLYRNNKWWYVYEKTKENAKYAKQADEKLLKKTGNYWIEAPDSHPQALIVLDSWPALLPEKMDDDDGKSGIGAQARMFSDQLKRIKGRMDPKRIVLMGVNQLRTKPMVMFGDPTYEPGGESLKFMSDCRFRMTSRAVPKGEPRKENSSQFAEEPSVTVEGGKDIYRYVHVRAIKNKLSVPDLEGWLRIWVRDGNGNAMGYDPVYDTYTFLKSIGAISGSRNKLKVDLQKVGIKGVELKPLSWQSFKTLIVGDKKQIEATLNSAGYKGKPFKLREKLFDLFKDGVAQKMYFDALKNSADASDADEGDD